MKTELTPTEYRLRANIRNFLYCATLEQLRIEHKISLERDDKLRARFILELIQEETAPKFEPIIQMGS